MDPGRDGGWPVMVLDDERGVSARLRRVRLPATSRAQAPANQSQRAQSQLLLDPFADWHRRGQISRRFVRQVTSSPHDRLASSTWISANDSSGEVVGQPTSTKRTSMTKRAIAMSLKSVASG